MSIFALIVEKGGLNIINKIKERLKETQLVKNPFIAKTQTIFYKEKYKAVRAEIIDIKPMYPNFTLFVALIGFAGFVISGLWFFMLVLLVALSLSLFWTKYFFIFMFKVALKRGGYKGQVKILTPGEIIEKVYFNGTN
jgi:hypothetical protein